MSIRKEISKPYGIFIKNGDGEEVQISDEVSTLDLEVDRDSLIYDELRYNLRKDFSCNINIQEEIDLTSAFGIDLSNTESVSAIANVLIGTKEIQIRKHKKKRIDKKWAKRYGYRYNPIYKLMKCDKFEITANDYPGGLDGSFEISMSGLKEDK